MAELKTGGAQGYLRIATEEAFITTGVLSAYKRLIAERYDDPGFVSLWGFYQGPRRRGPPRFSNACRILARGALPTWTRPASIRPLSP